MANTSSTIQCIGLEASEAILDDASENAKYCNAIKANTKTKDKASTFIISKPTTSCLEFYSTRIANMMANRGEFETELEFCTAHSKMHWSELRHFEEEFVIENPSMDHRQHFEKLQKDVHWGEFCSRITNVVLGKKLGEGAQADIYEAQVTFIWNKGSLLHGRPGYVVKLMKGDCALEHLQCQWPHGVGSSNSKDILLHLHGALVNEPSTKRKKFGFVMHRYWGDLRSLIDLRMEYKNAKGPPFSLLQAKFMIYWIAHEMLKLHERGIIHRDLKSSNVLVDLVKKFHNIVSNDQALITPTVADWECSIGVVGTGWWRAPEILLQLRNKTPISKLEFNEKSDVYSFAMTCYEIATGFIPFEGFIFNSELQDAILNGVRPKLPCDLDLEIRTIITSCWDPNPSLRPTFDKIVCQNPIWLV